MKIPKSPPDLDNLMASIMKGPNGAQKLQTIWGAGIDPAPDGKYRHWDKLRFLRPPEGLTVEEWWFGVATSRRILMKTLPLRGSLGEPFKYMRPDPMEWLLHEIDKNASGVIGGQFPEQVTTPGVRDRYIFKSLIEEAITSSQLEGAATTHRVAKDMLQTGRLPRNHGERMIYNNHVAMLQIRELENEPLTPEIVFELHRTLTSETLNDPSAAGRFRRADENVRVEDSFGNVLHTPPPASQLSKRLQTMCEFANQDASSTPFIHPVLRAILLHFWLAYDHPFVDGNGRTARALFYWSMARQGYWLCEFLSISRIIRKAPSAYARSFLYTETDNNDATYFIMAQLRVIQQAIKDLHEYLKRKEAEIYETRQLLKGSHVANTMLNRRQLALIDHALKNPSFVYSIESHRRAHNVSDQTARTDLTSLAKHNLLDKEKSGHAHIFIAPQDLRERLNELPKASTSRSKPNMRAKRR